MKAIALVLLTSCATLFSGNTATIAVSANPGQPVTVDGVPAGTSPTTIVVDNHKAHTISVGDRGCSTVLSVGAGWVILDIVTGLLPVIIDAVTGDWQTVDPSGCQI